MAERTPVVQLCGIGRRFGTDPPVDALKHVDLTIDAGDWLSIMGPSGSGKSTLLNILGCLDIATAGQYRFDGVDVATLGDRNRAGLRSRGIGFVFQSFHLLAHRTVLENVAMSEVYRHQSRKGRLERAAEALERVGLGHRSGFLPTRLSGGQRQRVAIARAIIGSPQLLLCDEPTGNLDSKTTELVMELLNGLHQHGMTIIMITHETDVAAAAPHQVTIIDGELHQDR